MSDLSQSSAEFIEKFAALAKRLAAIDIVTHTAELHWGSFGHFTFMVTKNEEAIRFAYDGRDSFVRVEASPIRLHSHPNEWCELLVKGIDKHEDEVIELIEEFLRKRFPA